MYAKTFRTSDLLFLFRILATLISISYAHNQGWLRWSRVCLEFSWICCAQWTTRRWPRWGSGEVHPTLWQRWWSQAAKQKLQTQSNQEYLCLNNMLIIKILSSQAACIYNITSINCQQTSHAWIYMYKENFKRNISFAGVVIHKRSSSTLAEEYLFIFKQ